MLSKWLDVGMNLAAFHYQCRQFQSVRPPTFGKNAAVRNLTRERERRELMSHEEMKAKLLQEEEEQRQQNQNNSRNLFVKWRERQRQRRRERSIDRHVRTKSVGKSITSKVPRIAYQIPTPTHSLHHRGRGRHRRGETRPSQQFDQHTLSLVVEAHSSDGGDNTPSLFLQESVHLLSLLSAVAMSTLRSDSMEADPPLVEHIPGRPWPPVDPDCLSPEIRKEFNESSRVLAAVRFLFGLKGRSHRSIVLYNAARPFRVLGGVSDAEMDQLSLARGPEAKVALCSKWLQEFITREYLAGSTGGVAPPIISRLYQFVSDGTIGFNQCRKISQIPFPFSHFQLTTIFIGVCVFVFPLLYYSYVNNVTFACVLNFVTVMCFVGVNEVARELEQPFRNVPNDLPLTTFQAQFNEALITAYAGFHPDAWSVEEQVTEGAPVASAATSASNDGNADQAAADPDAENRADREEESDREEEESPKRPSLDTMDLLAFFRNERAEATKSKKGEESPSPVTAPSPNDLLKKAAAPFLGALHGHDDEEGEESNRSLVAVNEPKSILKRADESKFHVREEKDGDDETSDKAN